MCLCELRALGTVTTNWRVLNGFSLRVAKGRASPLTHMVHPKGCVSSEEIYGVPYLSGLAGPVGNDGRQASRRALHNWCQKLPVCWTQYTNLINAGIFFSIVGMRISNHLLGLTAAWLHLKHPSLVTSLGRRVSLTRQRNHKVRDSNTCHPSVSWRRHFRLAWNIPMMSRTLVIYAHQILLLLLRDMFKQQLRNFG